MTNDLSTAAVIPAGLADEAISLATTWAKLGAADHGSRSAKLLAKALKDQHGLDFTVGFVDRVVRPEDLSVAGTESVRCSPAPAPAFLPWYMRVAVRLGGALAPALPWAVVPIARRVLRGMVGHLIVDARPDQLGQAIAKLKQGRHPAQPQPARRGGARRGARPRAGSTGTRAMLQRPDVDYVSIKVSSIVSQLSMWAFDETVERVVEPPHPAVRAGRRLARRRSSSTSTWRSTATSTSPSRCSRGILDQPAAAEPRGRHRAAGLPAGCARRVPAAHRSGRAARRAAAAPPIKVRVVKGANLAMEHVDATVHGWPLATYPTKQDTDTNYQRVLDWAMRPEHTAAVRIGVAGHNLFDIAFAHLLVRAARRRIRRRVRDAPRHGRGPGRCGARRPSAACCCTRRWCARRSSTWPSATWSAASRRTPARTTSCRRCSSWRTTGS